MTPRSADEIRAEIFQLVAEQTQVDIVRIRPDATLKALGIASLSAIEILYSIEERFDIDFPVNGANFDTDTLQDLVNAVVAARAESSADHTT